MFTHAIVRKPGKNFSAGLTTSNLGNPSYDIMVQQHQLYIDTLKQIGLQIRILEPLDAYPDAYFVEDTAVITSQMAVITNPGAENRRGEAAAIKSILEEYKHTIPIHSPGTVDGGDVLMIGNHFMIGISERTNEHGANQLKGILENYDYTTVLIPVGAGLHLKSSVNAVREDTLLVAQNFADSPALVDYHKIIIEADEEYAANSLWINDFLLIPKGFPKTKKQLEKIGKKIIEMDVSEARKMDGGLTCMSLRF